MLISVKNLLVRRSTTIFASKNNTTMKRVLLSFSFLAMTAALSFGQQEEIKQAPEVKKTEVKAVKAKKIKKSEKINATKLRAVEVKAVTREKAVKSEEKEEN